MVGRVQHMMKEDVGPYRDSEVAEEGEEDKLGTFTDKLRRLCFIKSHRSQSQQGARDMRVLFSATESHSLGISTGECYMLLRPSQQCCYKNNA